MSMYSDIAIAPAARVSPPYRVMKKLKLRKSEKRGKEAWKGEMILKRKRMGQLPHPPLICSLNCKFEILFPSKSSAPRPAPQKIGQNVPPSMDGRTVYATGNNDMKEVSESVLS